VSASLLLQYPYPDTFRGKAALLVDIALVIVITGFVSIVMRQL
jgi:hypothetical protein